MGIFDKNKLVYVFEVRNKKIVQIRAKHNHRMTVDHYNCFKEELDWEIVDREKPDTRFPRTTINQNDFFDVEAANDNVLMAELNNEVPF